MIEYTLKLEVIARKTATINAATKALRAHLLPPNMLNPPKGFCRSIPLGIQFKTLIFEGI